MKRKLFTTCIKYSLLMTVILAAFGMSAKAQDVPFKKGDKTVGLFVGTGVDYGYYASAAMPIVFGATYDQCFFENIGPGNIGIGGVLAYKTSTSNYNTYYKTSYRSFIVAVRGTYHLTILADKVPKLDPYAGITLGLSFNNNSYSYYYGYSAADNLYYGNLNRVSTVAGAFVGAKYNFAEHFGAFAEAGYDFSFLRGGINFNF